MYYKELRNHYRNRSQEATANQIAPVLGRSVNYAKKCLSVGCFTVDDKHRIMADLGLELDRAVEVFPPLGE